MTYCVIFGKPFKLGILNLLLRNEVDSFLSHALAFVKQTMSFLLCIKSASPGFMHFIGLKKKYNFFSGKIAHKKYLSIFYAYNRVIKVLVKLLFPLNIWKVNLQK